MSPDLQYAVLIADGAVIVLVPLLLLLLVSRIRNAAHESTRLALTESSRQHEQLFADVSQQHQRAIAESGQQYQRAIAESTRQHERALAEYAKQHERALAELSAEHQRMTSEFGMFSRKRHEVYARLYARYRRATRDFGAALTGSEPDFQKFSRDDLVAYLKARDVREKDAADAIKAMDRGDLFAMGKLMGKLHWRITLRDANVAFEKARDFEALNELYLSDAVLEAVGSVRRKVEALAFSLMREQERADQASRTAKADELQSAVASLLVAMRADLRGRDDAPPKKRLELDRVASGASASPALPARAPIADRVAKTS